MQKHHWFVLTGLALVILLPVYVPLHGAGIGLMAAGAIDWLWSRYHRSK